MELTREQIDHVAHLSRLALTEAERELFGSQLASILAYVEKLNELDTANVEPTAHAAALKNVFREDKSRPGMGIDKVLQNAPDGASPFFRVPKVLDLGEAAP